MLAILTLPARNASRASVAPDGRKAPPPAELISHTCAAQSRHPHCSLRLPPPDVRLRLRRRRRRPRCRATAAAARRVASHRRDGILDDQTELRGVVVGVVSRHEEVLRARRLKRDQEPYFLATHGQAMRHVLRERRVGPRFHLDLLVTNVRSDRALEDIEGLILARVGMDLSVLARVPPP